MNPSLPNQPTARHSTNRGKQHSTRDADRVEHESDNQAAYFRGIVDTLKEQLESLQELDHGLRGLFLDITKKRPAGGKLGFIVRVNADGSLVEDEEYECRVPAEKDDKSARRLDKINPVTPGHVPGLDEVLYGFAPPADDPLAAARKRGIQAASHLQQMEGGSWTGAELKSQFDVNAATLHRRRKEHRVVFWRDARNAFHYPRWQFTVAGALRPGIQEVLEIFRSDDGWRLTQYFLTPRQQLDNKTPLDLITYGQIDRVITHAKHSNEENTW